MDEQIKPLDEAAVAQAVAEREAANEKREKEIKKAKDHMSEAIKNLIQSEEMFYVNLISSFNYSPDYKIPTMGVGMSEGEVYLMYNPKFVMKLSIRQLSVVLIHEILHIVYKHIIRLKERDQKMWNMAGDLAINCLIPGFRQIMGDKFLHPETFWGGIKTELTAEMYYDLLKKKTKRISVTMIKGGGGQGKKGQPQNQPGKGKGQGQSGGGNGDIESDCEGVAVESTDGKSTSGIVGDMLDKSQLPKKEGKGKGKGKGEEEGQEGEGEGNELEGSGLTGDALSDAMIDSMIRKAADKTSSKGIGKLPRHLQDLIEALKKEPVIPWKQELKKFCGNKVLMGIRKTYTKPSRRLGWGFKGRVKNYMARIIIAIDTSGSVGDGEFQDFIAEICAIQKIYKSKITIIECDTQVNKVYDLKPGKPLNTKFSGRGGTELKRVFEYVAEKRLPVDSMIFFTDLGDYLDQIKVPPYPVLWAVSGDWNGTPAPWGKTLFIDKPEKNKRR